MSSVEFGPFSLSPLTPGEKPPTLAEGIPLGEILDELNRRCSALLVIADAPGKEGEVGQLSFRVKGSPTSLQGMGFYAPQILGAEMTRIMNPPGGTE